MPGPVALFGGSFNPPHVAHQMMCLYALSIGEVQEVWMLPTYAHAFGKELAPFEHRLAMCKRAAALLPGVKVFDYERTVSEQTGHSESRTIYTLEWLAQKHPDQQFRLLIGQDILAETEKWLRWDDVIAIAPPLVVGRPGFGEVGQDVGFTMPAISSTEIRRRLAGGESAVGLLPKAVSSYIAQEKLYAAENP